MMTTLGVFGFFVSHSTQSFLLLVAIFAIAFFPPYLGVRATRDKERFFEHAAEEKIRYRIFYKKATYLASVIDFIIIFILVSGIFHFSEVVQSI